MRRFVVLLMVLSACGSTGASVPGPEPLPPDTAPRWVIGAPDEVAFRHVVSGGIAGETFSDVVIYGDGTATVLDLDETLDLTVSLEELNRFLVELEDAGVFEIDPDAHPNVPVADGVGSGISVRTVNGTAELGIYGIGEAPELFSEEWHRIVEATNGLGPLLGR